MKVYLSMFLAFFSLGSISVSADQMPRSASPAGASVYIISPADGAVVTSPVTINFGLKGLGVAPAGTDKANTEHHHLLVDGKMMPSMEKPMGQEVKHFGAGQTETTVELTPGVHSLQLILGDKFHIPHNPPIVSSVINITVK